MIPLASIPSTVKALDLSHGECNNLLEFGPFLNRLPRFRDLESLDISNNELYSFSYDSLGYGLQGLFNLKVLNCKNAKNAGFVRLCLIIDRLRDIKLSVLNLSGSSIFEKQGEFPRKSEDEWRKECGSAAILFGNFLVRQPLLEEFHLPDASISLLEEPDSKSGNPGGFLWFCQYFSAKNLKVLSLGNNPLKDGMQKTLANCLSGLTQLEHIDFGRVFRDGLKKKALGCFIETFSSFTLLQNCSLAESRIGTTVACRLLAALPHPGVLKELEISGISLMTDSGLRPLNMKVLVPVLKTFTSLTSLNLSRNDMEKAPKGSIFEMLSPLVNIQDLYLNNAGIHDNNVAEVAQACALMPFITNLSIQGNTLTVMGSQHVIRLVQESSSIVTVDTTRYGRGYEMSAILEPLLKSNRHNQARLVDIIWDKYCELIQSFEWTQTKFGGQVVRVYIHKAIKSNPDVKHFLVAAGYELMRM